MSSERDDFDGFTVTAYLDEDGDWLAYLEEQPEVSAFAATPAGAVEELRVAWQGVKESYLRHGQQPPMAPSRRHYSGQFNVRIDRRVHRALAVEAARAGISLNALVAQTLARAVSVAHDGDLLDPRAGRDLPGDAGGTANRPAAAL